MNVLLDTHTLLWFVEGNEQLSSNARNIIEDASSTNFLSIASVWEMAIKISLGKLAIRLPLEEYISNALTDNGFLLLPITVQHASAIISLPFHHRDPFDRLMIAQALIEDMTFVSADSQFDAYPITRVW